MQKILEEDEPTIEKKSPVSLQLTKREKRKVRKENMRICYECPIRANEPHRYFPY